MTTIFRYRAAAASFLVALLLGFAAATAAQAHIETRQHGHALSCAAPRRAQLVAQDAERRIVAINEPRSSGADTDISKEWRYCIRAGRHGYRVLIDAVRYDGGLGDIVDVGPLALAGEYVTYSTDITASGGRYGDNPVGTVHVRNLVSGAGRSVGIDCGNAATTSGQSFCAVGPTDYFCTPPFCGAGAPVLILSADGTAAWQAAQKCIYQGDTAWRACAWTIEALDGRSGARSVLDELPATVGEYPADPFATLQLDRCTAGCSTRGRTVAIWTNDGSWHTAAVA